MTTEERIAESNPFNGEAVIIPHKTPTIVNGTFLTRQEIYNAGAAFVLALPDIAEGLELLASPCKYEDGFEAAMSRENVKQGQKLLDMYERGELYQLDADQRPPSSIFQHDSSADIGFQQATEKFIFEERYLRVNKVKLEE